MILKEDNSNNPFAIGDENRSKLLHTMQQFTAFMRVAEFIFQDAIEAKNLKITNTEISVIRSFQLLGALDYVGQGKGWTMEQLIEPFIAIVKEKPFEIDAQKAGKILGLLGNPTPEIIEIQINGAHVFEKIMNIMDDGQEQGREYFSARVLTVARENVSELSNLTSQALINTIKIISS